jgi:hypothetical protein
MLLVPHAASAVMVLLEAVLDQLVTQWLFIVDARAALPLRATPVSGLGALTIAKLPSKVVLAAPLPRRFSKERDVRGV